MPLMVAVLLAGCPGRSAPAAAPGAAADSVAGVDARATWDRLQRELPGTWVGTGEHEGLVVGYRVVSRGSALLETFGAAVDRQTLTVYHPDGPALMLTHYCGQGNQARLRATEVSPSRVRFEHVDATNVAAGGSVLHVLTFALGDETLDRGEVYRAADGSEETTHYHFVRSAEPTAATP